MKAITNTKLVMEDGVIWDGALTFEGGRIVQADWADKVSIPAGTETLDARGLYTAPGLIDIHNHGCGETLFYEDPALCAAYFLKHGETTVLPTLYPNISLADMLDGIDRIRAAKRTGAGRIIDGIYMEGPYMSGGGSNQSSMKWLGDIDPVEYRPLVDHLGESVRVWAIDPARKGIESFMAYCKQVNPNVIFSLGHSRASAAECRAVQHYGVKNQTHHGDSGKCKGRAQGTIGAGCDEYTLYSPDLYAELICDQNGVHVTPDMLKMVVRVKGVERIILITDSMASKVNYPNNEAEGIAFGPDLNYDDVGHLAGSRLTLEHACKNLMTHTGYGLCHAIRFATANPARMLGIDGDVGLLAPGRKANLILINDMVDVKTVLLEGETVVENE